MVSLFSKVLPKMRKSKTKHNLYCDTISSRPEPSTSVYQETTPVSPDVSIFQLPELQRCRPITAFFEEIAVAAELALLRCGRADENPLQCLSSINEFYTLTFGCTEGSSDHFEEAQTDDLFIGQNFADSLGQRSYDSNQQLISAAPDCVSERSGDSIMVPTTQIEEKMSYSETGLQASFIQQQRNRELSCSVYSGDTASLRSSVDVLSSPCSGLTSNFTRTTSNSSLSSIRITSTNKLSSLWRQSKANSYLLTERALANRRLADEEFNCRGLSGACKGFHPSSETMTTSYNYI